MEPEPEAPASRRRRLRRRLSDLQVLPFPLVRGLVRGWAAAMHRFVRVEREGPLFDFVREGRPCIVALWHQDVFPLMFELFRETPRWPSLFLVSHGRLGTLGSQLLGMWGIRCVAGSGPERGVEAVEALAAEVAERPRSVFLMADGSRGPARRARWGAVHLARATGLPIVPVRAWGDNLHRLEGSWMQLVLPHPWGHALLLSGAPLTVPAQADRAALDRARLELEARLEALVAQADARFPGREAGERPPPRVRRARGAHAASCPTR